MSTYVICEPCIGTKDGSCVDVCPAACIHTTPDAPQHYIDPDICIACEQCEIVCPVDAIYLDADVPPKWQEYIEINAAFFRENKVVRTSVGLEQAQAMLAAALRYARAHELDIAAAMVDQAGVPLLVEGVEAYREQAVNKAYTSALFRVGTHELGRNRNQPWLEAGLTFDASRLVTVPGALPIVDGPTLLGAIGVAGSPTAADDVQCCRVALAILGDH
ncbi:MAG: heme-binding protein [Chloroflexi bacterium]|nr:heme-binding protein [Chloroflexota bacterium]